VWIASPSTLVLKEDRVEGAPSLLGEVFNSLLQSQKWLVGFGPSGEIVVWDKGDEIWDAEMPSDRFINQGMIHDNFTLRHKNIQI
jgi:hypothetical protein